MCLAHLTPYSVCVSEHVVRQPRVFTRTVVLGVKTIKILLIVEGFRVKACHMPPFLSFRNSLQCAPKHWTLRVLTFSGWNKKLGTHVSVLAYCVTTVLRRTNIFTGQKFHTIKKENVGFYQTLTRGLGTGTLLSVKVVVSYEANLLSGFPPSRFDRLATFRSK